jgi:hypothetical protein
MDLDVMDVDVMDVDVIDLDVIDLDVIIDLNSGRSGACPLPWSGRGLACAVLW